MTANTETIDYNEALPNDIARDLVMHSGPTADVSVAITDLRAGMRTFITSIEGDDFGSKLDVIDAITTSQPLDENLRTVFELKNFAVQTIQMVNERTGELEDVQRTILIDANGTAYHAISKGVFSALENFVGVLGRPAVWDGPVMVYAEKLPAKVGKVMVLRHARGKKAGDKVA